MKIFDYTCKKCGHTERDKCVDKYDEEVICPICDNKMDKIFTGFNMKKSTRTHRKYPEHLVGRGDVQFGEP